jgi:tight adherence protein C
VEPVAIAVGLLANGALAFAAAAAWALGEHRRAAVEQRLSGAGAQSRAPAATLRSGALAATILARALAPLAALARPRRDDERGRLALKLARAGLRGPYAAQLFSGGRMVLAFTGLLVYLALAALLARPLPGGPSLGVILLAVGYYLPAAWLARRTRERQTAIEHGLPDALDLLVTCVEAGLGLDAAMQRVAEELVLAHPVLARELQLTSFEVNAGIPRIEALRRLASRTGVPDLKSLAATLHQTEVFGTGVANALRIQADGMRIQRMQRAEERAATVSVKLTVPLVLFILPSIFAVILGPAIVNMVRAFAPMLQGH